MTANTPLPVASISTPDSRGTVVVSGDAANVLALQPRAVALFFYPVPRRLSWKRLLASGSENLTT